jgi:hypothetical protein
MGRELRVRRFLVPRRLLVPRWQAVASASVSGAAAAFAPIGPELVAASYALHPG